MASLRPVSSRLNGFLRKSVHLQYCHTCHLHSSAQRSATPLPHGTIPGPPPPPPTPKAEPSLHDRIARKRKQAELLKRGRELKTSAARPATVLKKRFWSQASVKETPDGFQVMLDSRPVRNADKEILTLPKNKHDLAAAIALEWDQLISAQQALKQHYIPLTSFTSRAVDIAKADAAGITKVRDDVVKMVMRYIHTDTILCWAGESTIHEKMANDQGETLRQVQMRVSQGIIGYLTTHVWPGVEIVPALAADSILPTSQPEVTQEVVKGWISGLPAFELAGLERAVLATKSLLVAARLIVEWSPAFAHLRAKGTDQARFGIEAATEACTLEVRWQTDIWGEVDDTHDVDREDLRRQLGSVIFLVGSSA